MTLLQRSWKHKAEDSLEMLIIRYQLFFFFFNYPLFLCDREMILASFTTKPGHFCFEELSFYCTSAGFGNLISCSCSCAAITGSARNTMWTDTYSHGPLTCRRICPLNLQYFIYYFRLKRIGFIMLPQTKSHQKNPAPLVCFGGKCNNGAI